MCSSDLFEMVQFDSEAYFKLQEAEEDAELMDKRYSAKEVWKAMMEAIERRCQAPGSS